MAFRAAQQLLSKSGLSKLSGGSSSCIRVKGKGGT